MFGYLGVAADIGTDLMGWETKANVGDDGKQHVNDDVVLHLTASASTTAWTSANTLSRNTATINVELIIVECLLQALTLRCKREQQQQKYESWLDRYDMAWGREDTPFNHI